jgi:DNA-binding response OmpR family regulator
MNILVIDRDSLACQLIASKLAAKGHTVVTEPNKNMAFEKIRAAAFDCIMVDPMPLSEPKPVVIGIWKNIIGSIKPYLVLLSKTATQEEAILSGTNDVLLKPLNSAAMETTVGNAARLMEIYRFLAHEDNVHSGGGMVGKAAFNQLFISAIDRAFRYGERSLIIFLHMENYDEVLAAGGEKGVEETLGRLAEKMVFMRRQSDVLGRLSVRDYGILLQRPQYETEPMEALNRFTGIIDKFYSSFPDPSLAPRMHLSLIEVPQGILHAERSVPLAHASVLSAHKEDQHV